MDLEQNILDQIAPLVEAGFALHWLKPKSKAPVDDGWSEAAVATLADLTNTYRAGYNVGIRPGKFSKVGNLYLHLIDLDIRVADRAAEARAKLREILPEAASFPIVKSGSGGDSRHIYFLTDQPFRKKKLAHSDGFAMVYDAKKGREVKHWDWEIDLFGSGVQAAMPPSIHPDSGKPYTWVRPFDFDDLALGLGPFIPSDRVFSWAPQRDNVETGEQKPRLGMTLHEAKGILTHLPLGEWCEDRDGWLQVGMALHHEFGGSEEGFGLWAEFSKQSAKFDEKNQRQVWKSFRTKPNSVRMATLVKAAHIERLHDLFDEEDDEEDVQTTDTLDQGDLDLIGSAPSDDVDDDIALIGNAPAAPKVKDAEAPTVDPDWKQWLDLNEEGAIKPTLHNLHLILHSDERTRGVMRFNLFTQEVVFQGIPGTLKRSKKRTKPTKQLKGPIWTLRDPINGDLWTDEKDDAIRAVIEAPTSQGGYGIKVSDRDMRSAVNLVARDNAFHPIRNYLNDLVWDGQPRLDTMFIRYLGTPDNAYTRGISRLVLLGGVTRAFEPGHKFDYVAILEGLQGKRKSTFVAALARHWFSELHGDFHDTKGMVEMMQGSWVLEIPELQGFSKAEVTTIKGFVSKQVDTVRLAYAKRAQAFHRQCIFIGSTNESEYLRDNTGGRRFWPVECTVDSIDIDAFRLEVDQLWAEATHLYREMRAAQPRGDLPLYLSNAEAHEEAKRIQESRRVETAEDMKAGEIEAWLERPLPKSFDDEDEDGNEGSVRRDETCLGQIWVECLGNDKRSYDGRAAQMLGRAMKMVPGWINVGLRSHEKYGRQRTYIRYTPKR